MGKQITDGAFDESNITFIGRRKLKIENYRSILVFQEEEIRIQTKRYKIKIAGKRLEIPYYDKEEMEITGLIESVRFE